jgi:hypothetical protein
MGLLALVDIADDENLPLSVVSRKGASKVLTHC